LEISIKEKIEAIARSYGAAGVEYSEQVFHFILLISGVACKYAIIYFS